MNWSSTHMRMLQYIKDNPDNDYVDDIIAVWELETEELVIGYEEEYDGDDPHPDLYTNYKITLKGLWVLFLWRKQHVNT